MCPPKNTPGYQECTLNRSSTWAGSDDALHEHVLINTLSLGAAFPLVVFLITSKLRLAHSVPLHPCHFYSQLVLVYVCHIAASLFPRVHLRHCTVLTASLSSVQHTIHTNRTASYPSLYSTGPALYHSRNCTTQQPRACTSLHRGIQVYTHSQESCCCH